MRRSARDALTDLPDVRTIVDVGRGENVPGIGYADNGTLTTYHVTDRPQEVVRFLRRRPNLVASYGEKGRGAELGPGFYTSGRPEFWAARSRNKWSFLKRLTPPQWKRLLDSLERRTFELEDRGIITASEKTHAIRDLTLVASERADDSVLVGTFANPPYSIAFWKPEFLKSIGIEPGEAAGIVTLRIRGRFAELSRSRPTASTLRTLRRAGLQGAFTRAGMSTNPELVIWDPRAIVSAAVEAAERDPSRRRRLGRRRISR